MFTIINFNLMNQYLGYLWTNLFYLKKTVVKLF